MDSDPARIRRIKQITKIAIGFAIIGATSLAIWYLQNKQKSPRYHSKHTNALNDAMVAQYKNENNEKDEIKQDTNINGSVHYQQEEKSIEETSAANAINTNTNKPENDLFDLTEDKKQENINQFTVQTDVNCNKNENITINLSTGKHKSISIPEDDTVIIKKMNVEDDKNVENENEKHVQENVIGNNIKQGDNGDDNVEKQVQEETEENDETDALVSKILNRGRENPEGTPSYSYSTQVVMDSNVHVFGDRWSGDGYEFNENNEFDTVINEENTD